VAIVLAEQNLPLVLRVADEVCVLHDGVIALHTTPAAIAVSPDILDRYLGTATGGDAGCAQAAA
jgi:ABC-type branched-subunit amino acid transport system ATPase component